MSFETRADVARAARAYAVASKVTEGHGKRGRVAKPVVLAYLSTEKPSTVREIGTALGVEVPAKGRLSESTLDQIATVVTGNAPKSE